jgi:hypothetical protein
MTESREAEMPIQDQIVTRPVEGVIYRSAAGLHRWTAEHGWQKEAGWYPCDDPSPIRLLIEGPSLVPTRREPTFIGAVVEEHVTGDLYVRTVDGRWFGEPGEKTWAEISYPVVKHIGATT